MKRAVICARTSTADQSGKVFRVEQGMRRCMVCEELFTRDSQGLVRRDQLERVRQGSAAVPKAGHRLNVEWITFVKQAKCRIRKGNESSNPNLSATQSGLQRNSATLSAEIRETCPYFGIIRTQSGLQRTDCPPVNAVAELAFLRRAHRQSGFTEDSRRMQCDQRPGIRA
jgi:hypothetical protein